MKPRSNFSFLILLTKLYYVSTFLLSWQRYAYGIQDAETVKYNIDLRMKQWEAIMLSSNEVFPTVFRSKRFKSKASNIILQNPSIWHCSTCTDSNPKNPFLHPSIGMSGEEDYEEDFESQSLAEKNVTSIGLPELAMEPHNPTSLGLNESELMKLFNKDEIVQLVEEYYSSQAYALTPVPLPSQKFATEQEAAATEGVVQEAVPEVVQEVAEILQVVPEVKEIRIEEEIVRFKTSALVNIPETIPSTTEIPSIESVEVTKEKEETVPSDFIAQVPLKIVPLLPSLPVEDLKEDLQVVEEIAKDKTIEALLDPSEVPMSQAANNFTLIEQLEEQIEGQKEMLSTISDTLEVIREDIELLHCDKVETEASTSQEEAKEKSSDYVQDEDIPSADFLPVWFLTTAFVAGVVCMALFSFAVYSLYQYWTSYPSRFITWLERRIIKLFDEKKYDQVISELNTYMSEVKRLKGSNHIDTCAFKHYMARAYIALSEGKPALELLQEVLSAYQPFGEDVYLAQVYEDIGISQHNLEEFGEALLNLQTALKIFTEEYSCESGDWKKKASNESCSPEDQNIADDLSAARDCVSEESEPGLNFDYSTISSPEIVIVDGPCTPFAKYDEKAPLVNANFTDNIYPSDEHISQSLDTAFVNQVDLNTAMKELEDLLADDKIDIDMPSTDPTIKTKVFKELQEVAHVDIARVCKELGDVYNDISNFEEALVFYKNALDILLKLLPKDCAPVECLTTLVNTTQAQLTKSNKKREDLYEKNPKSSPVSITYFATYQTKSDENIMPVK